MMSEAMNRREFLSRRGLGEMLRKAAPLLGINGEGVAGDVAAALPDSVRETPANASGRVDEDDGVPQNSRFKKAISPMNTSPSWSSLRVGRSGLRVAQRILCRVCWR